jgi:hypothetical protein
MITSFEHLLRFDNGGGLNNRTDWKVLAFFDMPPKWQADAKGSEAGERGEGGATIMANM